MTNLERLETLEGQLEQLSELNASQENTLRCAIRATFESMGEDYPCYLDEYHNESLIYVSQEEIKEKLRHVKKLKTLAVKIGKGLVKGKEAIGKAYNWYQTDGKGLITNAKEKLGAIKESNNLRDVDIPESTNHLITMGVKIKPLFDELTDELHDQYIEDKTKLDKLLKRVQPGAKLGTSLASFNTQQTNQSITLINDKVDEIREEINKVKAKARDMSDKTVKASTLTRELSESSDWLEDTVKFIKALEKDSEKWEESLQRLERIMESEKTRTQGAEQAIKIIEHDVHSKLLRLCNTLIQFNTTNIATIHKKLTEQ